MYLVIKYELIIRKEILKKEHRKYFLQKIEESSY